MGAGFALSTAGLIDALMIHTIYRQRYHFVFSFRLTYFYVIQFCLLSTVVWASFQSNLYMRYTIDAIAVIISACLSLRILIKETTFLKK